VLDSTLINVYDLEGYPLLSAVPFDKEASVSPLITQVDKYSIRVESFRLLRTNLQFLSPEKPPKVISIASALPGEGKTTTAINVSISLVLAGFKVLLLECDLRRPKVAMYLGLPKTGKGISEFISSRVGNNLNQYLQSFYPNPDLKLKLDFIPSGVIPPNPSELLTSSRFESLIKSFSKNYDYVILDSPPILPVSDASIIATSVDGVLLVIHAGNTKKTQYQGAIDAIESVNSSVLGVMLNMIPADSRRAQDYGYKYGYAGEYSSAYGYSYRYSYGSKKELLAYAPQDQIPQKIEISDLFSRLTKRISRRKFD
jgi:capsular exopolysaccharide synthesis family protein